MSSTPNVNTSQLATFVDLIDRAQAPKWNNLVESMRNSGLVRVSTRQKGTGLYDRIQERTSISPYAKKRSEGDVADSAVIQTGYEKDLTITDFAMSLSVTKMFKDSNKRQQEFADILNQLSNAPVSRLDLDLSNRITYADATSYSNIDGDTVDTTVGDDLSLVNSAHTIANGSTTYSNVITGNPQFSKGALESALRSAVENTYDNLGNKVSIDFDIIFTTDDPTVVHNVRQFLNSTSDNTQNNPGVENTHRRGLKHVILPRIATQISGSAVSADTSKRNYWGIASSMASSFYLEILNAPYSTMLDPQDTSETVTYLTRCSYGIAIVDGRWIRLSTGTGA